MQTCRTVLASATEVRRLRPSSSRREHLPRGFAASLSEFLRKSRRAIMRWFVLLYN